MSELELLKYEELFMDLLDQACGHYNKKLQIMQYDHLCISSYEQAVRYALEQGWIDEEQVTR